VISEETELDEQRTNEPGGGAYLPYITNKTRLDPFGLAQRCPKIFHK